MIILNPLDHKTLHDHEKSLLFSSNDNPSLLLKTFHNEEKQHRLVLLSPHPKETLKRLKSHYVLKKAAGGLVLNRKNELLVIDRLGYLDLPKGHCEKGELRTDTALREVAEECGIKHHSINNVESVITHHVFLKNRDWIWKETHWFKMKTDADEILVPQTSEGIEAAFWMTRKNVIEQLHRFYPSLVSLIEQRFIA